MKQPTYFSLDECYQLSDLMRYSIKVGMFSGRGRMCMDSQHDLNFMLLVTPKHGREWPFFASIFKKHIYSFEKTMMRVLFAIVSDLEIRFIVDARKSCCTMKDLASSRQRSKYIRLTLCVTNIKFYHSNRPHGNHQKSKPYFSRKHHSCGIKKDVAVSPRGLAILISPQYPGGMLEVTIFRTLPEKKT